MAGVGALGEHTVRPAGRRPMHARRLRSPRQTGPWPVLPKSQKSFGWSRTCELNLCLGFLQKQLPDRRRISIKTTLTLTLSRPTGEGTARPVSRSFQNGWIRPTDRGRFSLSHPMGEGRDEGEFGPKSEIVFVRVLRRRSTPSLIDIRGREACSLRLGW